MGIRGECALQQAVALRDEGDLALHPDARTQRVRDGVLAAGRELTSGRKPTDASQYRCLRYTTTQ